MRGINYRERTLSYLSWPMERVFFTCRKLSVINNNFNNNHFTFCQNDFKYSPSNSHPSYKPFGLLVFLRITWTRVIIYGPKPNPFLRPPTFCSPLSHPLPPPPPTTPKRNINKKDNENKIKNECFNAGDCRPRRASPGDLWGQKPQAPKNLSDEV